MAIQAAEAQDIEAKIADAAMATEALARRFFGPAAYLVIEGELDRETGDEEAVFEVHYGFEYPVDDFDRIAELHDAFTSAFVRAVPPEVLSRVVLDAIPCESDEPFAEVPPEAARKQLSLEGAR
jgi:hypothetical protein